jgi:hypothetical protein
VSAAGTNDVLIVEGGDDGAVVNALVHKRLQKDISATKLVKVGRGDADAGFETALTLFASAANQLHPNQRLGLLVDRDAVDGKPDRWDAVQAVLKRFGYELSLPPGDGWIANGPKTGSRLGVWLMPDNIHPGDLESFVEALLPADRALWDFACSATTTAREHGAPYLEKDARKARVHAWLAWLNEPGGGYGIALRRGNLSTTAPAADAFLSWFERLFLAP